MAADDRLAYMLGCERGNLGEGRAGCLTHGGRWPDDGTCTTAQTLLEVAEHRAFQYANYGDNRDLPDGTGPDVEWLAPVVDEAFSAGMQVVMQSTRQDHQFHLKARDIEGLFRKEWDYDNDPEAPYSWMLMLREEVSEAFKENDPEWLHGELIQVSALAAAWADRIKERS